MRRLLVEGARCDRYDVIRQPGVPPNGVLVDAAAGLNRRIMTHRADGSVALQIDWLDVIVGPPPRELFEPPPGNDARARAV